MFFVLFKSTSPATMPTLQTVQRNGSNFGKPEKLIKFGKLTPAGQASKSNRATGKDIICDQQNKNGDKGTDASFINFGNCTMEIQEKPSMKRWRIICTQDNQQWPSGRHSNDAHLTRRLILQTPGMQCSIQVWCAEFSMEIGTAFYFDLKREIKHHWMEHNQVLTLPKKQSMAVKGEENKLINSVDRVWVERKIYNPRHSDLPLPTSWSRFHNKAKEEHHEVQQLKHQETDLSWVQHLNQKPPARNINNFLLNMIQHFRQDKDGNNITCDCRVTSSRWHQLYNVRFWIDLTRVAVSSASNDEEKGQLAST